MIATRQDAEAVRSMTFEEKLAVLQALIRQAWELKEAWIRAREPERPEEEVRILPGGWSVDSTADLVGLFVVPLELVAAFDPDAFYVPPVEALEAEVGRPGATSR